MSLNPLSPRAFIALAGAAAGSATLAGPSAFASPFSDSSQGAKSAGNKPGTVPVGIELYTVRDALKADLMGTVRGVAKMGYQVVEFYSPYYDWTPQQAGEVKKLLDDLGVKALSTHNSATVFTPEGIQKAIDLNQAIGSKCIVMASAGGRWRMPRLEGCRGQAEFRRRKARAARHDRRLPQSRRRMAAVEGQRPMDILAKNTKKEVALQLDLGTCVEAGSDPVAWINANPGRIKSLHCKEWSKEKGYEVLFGEGQVPWAGVFKAAESTGGVEFYLIEQEAGPSDEQMARAEKCLANWKKMRPAAARRAVGYAIRCCGRTPAPETSGVRSALVAPITLSSANAPGPVRISATFSVSSVSAYSNPVGRKNPPAPCATVTAISIANAIGAAASLVPSPRINASPPRSSVNVRSVADTSGSGSPSCPMLAARPPIPKLNSFCEPCARKTMPTMTRISVRP